MFRLPPRARLPHPAVTIAAAAPVMLCAWLPTAPGAATATAALAGVAALALALWQMLRRLGVPDPDRAAALILLLPSVALNGVIGAHDTLWAAILLLALVAALDRRHDAMLGWAGLAIGLNPQAALIAPLFVALLINRRVPLLRWPIAPLGAAAALLGTGGVGWTIGLRPLLHEAITGHLLALDAPNIWTIVQTLPLGYPLLGLAIAIAIGTIATVIAHFAARPIGDHDMIAAALLCTMLAAGLLPLMHERAFFLADILSLALALVRRDRAHWRIALLIQAGSTLALLGHASGIDALTILGGGMTIAATALLAGPLLRPAANDNPVIARSA